MPKATTRPRLSEAASTYRQAIRFICAEYGHSVNAGLLRYADDVVRVERCLTGLVQETIYRTDGPGMDTPVFQVVGMEVTAFDHDPDIARHLHGLVTGGPSDG